MRRIINVNLGRGPERTYRVIVEDGLVDRAADLIARAWHGKRVFVISDSNVGPLYGGELLRRFLGAGMDAALLNVAAGEASKDARTVQALYTNLLRLGMHRDSLIIALGGGVVGDIAGFVAATIVRGVPYVQIPTSLLAQVDSSVGGKVGINHKMGKNLIGAFHQPAAVFIDPQVLRTLPQAEFRNGLAEVVKIAAALDAPFFRLLERKVLAIAKRDPKLLPSVIARSVALKARIVERDERETGLRKALNLGHTIGHAVEAALQYRIRHGEAVAIGMAAECSIAVEMGLLHPKTRDRVVRLLQQCGLPVRMPRIEHRSRFLSALALDKKAEAGSPRFTLLSEPGKVVVGIDVPTAFVNQLLNQRN